MSKRVPITVVRRINKHRYILQKIARSTPQKRKEMIRNAPTPFFTIVKDICKLVADGHLKLGKATKHSGFATSVSKKKGPAIKALARQKGGLIGSILAGTLPFLAPLLSKIFK